MNKEKSFLWIPFTFVYQQHMMSPWNGEQLLLDLLSKLLSKICSNLLQIFKVLIINGIELLYISQIPFRKPCCIWDFSLQVNTQACIKRTAIFVFCIVFYNVPSQFPIEPQHFLIYLYRCFDLTFTVA